MRHFQSYAVVGETSRRNLSTFYFLPGAGAETGAPGSSTNGISNGERGAIVVAAGIEENAAFR